MTSPREAGLPRIAIAGRPNVGKSTLFNRLIKKRKAITDPTPGVTRDPIEGSYNISGIPMRLVDTGGYKLENEGFDELVSQKSLLTASEADLILLVLDVTEVTPEDESFMKMLRPYTEKVMLVINKIDSEERENLVWNYYSYGFEKVIGISATHGRGIAQLEEEILNYLETKNFDYTEVSDPIDIRLAILGKPNAGKSTLTNALVGEDRSIVSDIPGTTRDVIEGSFHYKGKNIQVLDTAGIRKKKKVAENVEYYSVNRAISTIDDSDVVLLMIDSIEGLTDQDKKIADHVVKHGKGILLVLNKWDLKPDIENLEDAEKDKIRYFFPILDFAPILTISAKEKTGLKELLNKVIQVQTQRLNRIDTGRLNQALADWVDQNPAPNVKGKSRKIRYITQVSANPVSFVYFVNRKVGFPAAYIEYITNRIRRDFGFHHIPILVEVRESK
ncbi:ribosome biogenesis GTPase Der [Spirochaeta cellobiosiphila]|uniref:ribosome biogenesis GTPase Der n=1 Tax=Spirochaeta cellobiosiphila TaxID=504483 RepID=UPI00040F94F2|nr:ribosome biogenesis GTPase Der [Spirochaeta cellobiosiphila]